MDIEFEGKVLSGRQRVLARHREVEAMELISRTVPRRGLPDGQAGVPLREDGEAERYADMADYDPVLRWHCRI